MLSGRATPDRNRDQQISNWYVSKHYSPLEFEVPFNPKEPSWNKIRLTIQSTINNKNPDGLRKWVWGLYGMDGRVSSYELYDWYHTSGAAQFDHERKKFADGVAKPGSKLSLKAKWSWTEEAALMHKADLRTVSVNASVASFILDCYKQPEKVYILHYGRVSRCFEKALPECPELAECRRCLGEERFKHKSGAKVFVSPELYAATVYEMERDDEKFQSRHVIASERFLEVVRIVVARDTDKKLKITEKRCDQLKIMPPVKIKNGFVMFYEPPGSMVPSSVVGTRAASAP